MKRRNTIVFLKSRNIIILLTVVSTFLPVLYVANKYLTCSAKQMETDKLSKSLRDPGASFQNATQTAPKPRKIFLDCGANIASSVLLVKEIYPSGREYEIHSFEIDDKLGPYFAAYSGINAHIPMGVATENGKLTAYLEGPWFPGKVNNEKDMQWGGGTLFVSSKEKHTKDGGPRKLSRHVTVHTVDLSQWIQQNTRKEDYVILKLDVEGAEYGILRKMLTENTFDWVDKFYGEFHISQPTGFTKEERDKLDEDLESRGVKLVSWAGEYKSFDDFDALHKIQIPSDTPGNLGKINNMCVKKAQKTQVTIVIEVGMNSKTANRLIETIRAYGEHVPLTLFVYGDFVDLNPGLIANWSKSYEIGIRAGSPTGLYWQLQNKDSLRLSISSAEVRLLELDLVGKYILPPGFSENVVDVVNSRNLRLIKSTISFPPKAQKLTWDSYFKFRDVERIPKALKVIHSALVNEGGILSLDSDFPDSYMTSMFLLDYLYQISSHNIVSLQDCLKG